MEKDSTGKKQPAKYGLRIPTAKAKAAAPPKITLSDVFGPNGDDDSSPKPSATSKEFINLQLRKTPTSSQKDIQKLHEKVLAEDPHAFDYDAIYDKVKYAPASKSRDAHAQPAPQKPQYVETLLARAAERKAENERIRLRQLQRERVSEDPTAFADKEVFVTAAYRRKLAEMETATKADPTTLVGGMKEDEAKEAMKGADFTKFYANLYKRDAQFGKGGRYGKAVGSSQEPAKLGDTSRNSKRRGPAETHSDDEDLPGPKRFGPAPKPS